MKVQLHDNAREAFQFLSLGAAVVLGIRLLLAGIGLWSDADGDDLLVSAMSSFRNGYPLIARNAMVVGGMDIVPRLAVAALFALSAGVLGSLLTVPLWMALGRRSINGAVFGARVGLTIGGAWAIYALLCLPVREVLISDAQLVRIDRPAFLDVIPWPFVEAERAISWEHVTAVEQFDAPSSTHSCGEDIEIRIRTAEGTLTIAQGIPGPGDCGTMHALRQKEADQAAHALRSRFLASGPEQ